MDPDAFIANAIDTGSRDHIDALHPDQRLVFLISEAEVICDKDGIDTFLGLYSPRWIEETAAAFIEIGATEIGWGLGTIATGGEHDDRLLDRVNGLITSRTGYDYESIRKAVERRLAGRSH